MFSYSCPKFKCLYTFSRIVDFFQCKLTFICLVLHYLLNGPDKKPKQNSSKTKQHRQHQEAKKVNLQMNSCQQFFGALLQGFSADWLVCLAILYFLAYLIGSDHLSYFSLNCTVCLFVKESPIRYFGWVRGKNNICHLIMTDLSRNLDVLCKQNCQRTRNLLSFKKLKSIAISKNVLKNLLG